MTSVQRPPGADLQAELSRPTDWKLAMFAVLATVAAVAGAIVLVPSSSRDFRREGAAAAPVPGDAVTLAWSQLVPPGWDASAEVRRLQAGHAGLRDDAPVARASLARLREVLDAAPGDPTHTGRRVRLPGYVVPLERQGDRVAEFLLVPYFGACIHTPPPPANQIVHVVLATPREALRSMDPVWVTGTLHLVRQATDVAVSTYRLEAASAEPHP